MRLKHMLFSPETDNLLRFVGREDSTVCRWLNFISSGYLGAQAVNQHVVSSASSTSPCQPHPISAKFQHSQAPILLWCGISSQNQSSSNLSSHSAKIWYLDLCKLSCFLHSTLSTHNHQDPPEATKVKKRQGNLCSWTQGLSKDSSCLDQQISHENKQC